VLDRPKEAHEVQHGIERTLGVQRAVTMGHGGYDTAAPRLVRL
jgi:hypothetical protein